MKNFIVILMALCLFVLLPVPSVVHAKTEPVYRALDDLVDRFKSDLKGLSRFATKTSVVDMTVSENLGEHVQHYTLSKIESLPTSSGLDFRFIQCKDCFALRAEKEGDQIRVSKGVNDKEELMQLINHLGVDSYSEIRVNYSGFSLRLHINVYSLSKSELLWGKTYSTRLVTLGQSKLHISLGYSQAFGKKKSQPWGGEIFLAERIYGLGSFGFSTTYLRKHGFYHDYIVFAPSMELSINDMFNKHFSFGDIRLILKLGFGLYNSKRNFSAGGGIKIKYGHLIYTSLQWIGSIQESKDFELEEDTEEEAVAIIGGSGEAEVAVKEETFPFTMILSLGFDFD